MVYIEVGWSDRLRTWFLYQIWWITRFYYRDIRIRKCL